MTRRLPSLKAIDVVRALRKAGFEVVRTRGSHLILRHRNDASRATVVPSHAGRDIKRGLLHKIVADAGLTIDEFIALL